MDALDILRFRLDHHRNLLLGRVAQAQLDVQVEWVQRVGFARDGGDREHVASPCDADDIVRLERHGSTEDNGNMVRLLSLLEEIKATFKLLQPAFLVCHAKNALDALHLIIVVETKRGYQLVLRLHGRLEFIALRAQ
eukprot:5721403-Prymnesium_polylepis.1